jgi:sugar-specific transcriptional regulator TrmB
MQNTKLTKILTDLGLSEHEALVYLANISLGPTTILKIAQAAEIKRTTVYAVIESLKTKGLINVQIKGFKKLFAPENPEKLETILENRKNLLNKAMPDFSALFNLKGTESAIKYYEGLEGIKTVYESLLKDVRPHDDYLIISNQQDWYQIDPEYFLDFIERRAKLPIKIRFLTQEGPISREHKKLEKNFNEHIKFLPKETSLNTNLVIIPKKVVIHQLTPPIMAMVIENQSVVRMHKELFEIIWKSV